MLQQNVYDGVETKPSRNRLSLPAGARIMKVSVYCKKIRGWKFEIFHFWSFPPSVTACPSFTFPSLFFCHFHSLKRKIRGITPGQILNFCFAVRGFLFRNVVTNSGSSTRNNWTNFRALIRCRLFNYCSHTILNAVLTTKARGHSMCWTFLQRAERVHLSYERHSMKQYIWV